MNDFTFHNPTRILFGKNRLAELGEEIKNYGDSVLLLYGKGSIKKTGLLDIVVDELKKNGIRYEELGGVDPNPRLKTVKEGVKICKDSKLDLVLAVGGGSVLDCAKAICLGAVTETDPWDFWTWKAQPEKALPLGTILTLSATGSEMNQNSVITNLETEEKRGYGHDLMRPRFSFLDPTLTNTVGKYQTACGSADIFCHLVEFYFDRTDSAYLQNRMIEAVMKTVVHYGPIAIAEPENYEARANLMWASSMALNGSVSEGKVFEGFNHETEHAISAVTDVTHGAGLSILMTHWMEEILSNDTLPKFVEFARYVWDIKTGDEQKAAEEGILALRSWLQSMDLPVTLHEADISLERIDDFVAKALNGNATLGNFVPLDAAGIAAVLKRAE